MAAASICTTLLRFNTIRRDILSGDFKSIFPQFRASSRSRLSNNTNDEGRQHYLFDAAQLRTNTRWRIYDDARPEIRLMLRCSPAAISTRSACMLGTMGRTSRAASTGCALQSIRIGLAASFLPYICTRRFGYTILRYCFLCAARLR